MNKVESYRYIELLHSIQIHAREIIKVTKIQTPKIYTMQQNNSEHLSASDVLSISCAK